jgi:hypothetical protein
LQDGRQQQRGQQMAQSTTTIAQGGGGSYTMVDTRFFGHTKNDDKIKIWKVYCLFYILSVFSSSHPPILHPLSFFILSIHNNIISS